MLKSVQKRIGIGMLFFSLAIFYVNINCYAEGAGDNFLYDVNKLPKDILIDTIGIISFSNGEIEKGVQQYERGKSNFIGKNIIQIKEAHPVGKGGYGGWYKYLVVDVFGEYVKIIYNPYRNLRAWVKPNKKSSVDRIIIFDELIGKSLKSEMIGEIDAFILSKEIKLYNEPKESSNYVLFKAKNQRRRVFYPIAFRKDFIQIGEEFFDDDAIETTYGEPIGWIKTRNNEGAITFYLYLCFWL